MLTQRDGDEGGKESGNINNMAMGRSLEGDIMLLRIFLPYILHVLYCTCVCVCVCACACVCIVCICLFVRSGVCACISIFYHHHHHHRSSCIIIIPILPSIPQSILGIR
mmetsp:Transcript_47133/g.47986  ORF Transcript_47133/g.47986 Transcript_47133/m.47986 type:complete len:109 (-) Transcript_47133:534-860(-)